MILSCPPVQYGRQRDFLVRERVGKDGFFAISIRHHYRYMQWGGVQVWWCAGVVVCRCGGVQVW